MENSHALNPSDLRHRATALRAMADELDLLARHIENPPPERNETLMTYARATETTGLSRFQLKRLVSEGTLSETRVGARVYLTRASLERLAG